jgi:hypothetical protein
VSPGVEQRTLPAPVTGPSTRPSRIARPDLTFVWPVALAVGSALTLWVVSDVAVRQVAVFVGYELGFVVLPGWLLYRVLAPDDSAGRTVTFGWALGYVLEIGAYIVVSALGARGLFPFYPLVLSPLLIVLRRRGMGRRERAGSGPAWTVAVVGVVSLAYIGISYFATAPLPWRITKVTYFSDIPYHLSLAAEALHHWPMVDPNVSGTGLYYHVWAHLDMAATTSVTGLPLPLMLLRLSLVPLTLLFLAELTFAGRTFTGRAWVGAVAAGLLLLVGEADVQPWNSYPFLGFFFIGIWFSPTFLLGLVFFVPAVTLIAERLDSDEGVRTGWKRWVLIGLFLVGCGGAKATILSVLLGALVLLLGLRWTKARRVGPNGLMALASVGIAFLAYYLAIYRHSALGLGWDPLGSIAAMGWITDLRNSIGNGIGWPLGVVLGTLGLFGAQLAGLPVLIALRRRLTERRVLLLALFIVGLGPFYFLHQPGNSQLFFTHYGLVAAALLSAEGIVLLFAGWPARAVVRATAANAYATAALVVLLVYAVATVHGVASAFVVALALGTAFVALWRWSSPSGRANGRLSALVIAGAVALLLVRWLGGSVSRATEGYVFVAALLGGTALAAALSRGVRRRELALFLVAAAVTVGALDVPLDYGPGAIDHLQAGTRFYRQSSTGLNRGLYEGLSWIRSHTSDDAVLAVNNYYDGTGRYRQATYFDYAAFAERRVFLEGWISTATAWNTVGNGVRQGRKVPFPERFRLNNAVFQHADRKALSVMVHGFGVRYLVDDRIQGTASSRLGRLGRIAFENPAVIVYAVGPAS